MKRILIVFLLITPLFIFGQSEIEKLVSAGVELHDAGKYEEAIAKYEEALKIDKKSSLVNYELGYTFLAQKAYKKAIKPLDRVIKNDGKHLKDAYMTKGSCLDYLGKPKEAIKVYQKAIEKFPEHYLLHFNLALTQFNDGDQKGAEANLIEALYLNGTHPTSNYLLGIIKSRQDRRIESLLAIHFFLLFESNSNRSLDAVKILQELMGQGVVKGDDNNIKININSLGLEDEFSSANLMLSMLSAGNMTEENKDKTSQELFYENTESLLTILVESKEGKTGIYWDLYINFYSELVESKNVEAYCYYITQSKGETEKQWIEANKEKMEKFFKWASE